MLSCALRVAFWERVRGGESKMQSSVVLSLSLFLAQFKHTHISPSALSGQPKIAGLSALSDQVRSAAVCIWPACFITFLSAEEDVC